MLGDKVPELTELKEQLKEYIKELSKKKAKTLDIIRTMSLRKQRIMILYYLQNHTIEKTAEEMGKSYTWTWTELQDAVDEFEKIFKKI